MSVRELVVLGTASQVPTRERAHNGLWVRWGPRAVLVDPGEGTQRQLTFAGLSVAPLTDVLLTHAHGDHCLGLPGVLQRCSLDGVPGPVHVRYPEAAHPYVERLAHATPHREVTDVRLAPAAPGAVVLPEDGPHALGIEAVALSHGTDDHPVPTLGWRLREPDGWRFDVAALRAAGVRGPDRAELAATGAVTVAGRRVTVDQVARPRRGRVVAIVMDTRDGPGAREAAAGADLLVIEATFLDDQRELAEEVGHLTAGQAARLAREVGARRIVLTHLSQRYPGTAAHESEAHAAAPGLDLHVARDLDRFAVPATC